MILIRKKRKKIKRNLQKSNNKYIVVYWGKTLTFSYRTQPVIIVVIINICLFLCVIASVVVPLILLLPKGISDGSYIDKN